MVVVSMGHAVLAQVVNGPHEPFAVAQAGDSQVHLHTCRRTMSNIAGNLPTRSCRHVLHCQARARES